MSFFALVSFRPFSSYPHPPRQVQDIFPAKLFNDVQYYMTIDMRWRSTKHRFFALILAALGAAINFVLAAQLLSFSRALKWEPDSEWEGATDGWRIDSVRLVWALLSAYFAISFVACCVGVVGVIKVRLPFPHYPPQKLTFFILIIP